MSMLKAALRYAEHGYLVFPAHSSGQKKSHKSAKYSNGENWGATNDAPQIKRDFKKFKFANVGIVTGSHSGIFVLDVDTNEGHGIDGLASLKKLEHKHGKLPETLTATTPSGGLHYYFTVPEGCRIKTTTSKLGGDKWPGIDIKGDGGMVLAPPSVRPDRGQYTWLGERAVADAPQWLINLVKDDDVNTAMAGEPEGDPERIARAVAVIPNKDLDWDSWNRIGLAIYRASGASEEGRAAFDTWSQKSGKYDEETTSQRWTAFDKCPPCKIGMGTLVYEANKASPAWDAAASRDDFVSYLPDHKYIYEPTGALWPGKSVNAILPKTGGVSTSDWLDKHRAVHQMAWAPGEPKLIQGRLFGDGGWFEKADASCFNLYRPPAIRLGDAKKAKPWIDHVKRVYPQDYEHIIDYAAHLVQHPNIKRNHALVLGGPMGSGKDTLLEPVRQAVGPWNCQSIKPKDLFEVFNSYVRTVMLQINEVHDSGEVTRNQLYETMKIYEAAPPEVLRCNDKFVPAHYVVNVCGVIYTTNYPNALYLPPDDRRHYVAWSEATYDDLGGEKYFDRLWDWYYCGGLEHVAAYLTERDISKFNPKAPPRKTDAFWMAVEAHQPPEESAIAKAIAKLRDPAVLTLECLADVDPEIGAWIARNSKGPAVPNVLRRNGYTVLLNANDKTKGLWMIDGERQRVYARIDLEGRDHADAVAELKYAKECPLL